MARHLARRGGVWWARLGVPKKLRDALGRREFIQSCRTPDLQVAKLVAAVLIAEWRRSLMRLECHTMNSNVSKLLASAPELSIGSTVNLVEAEKFGVDRAQLLRIVSDGKVPLYFRVSGLDGYIVNAEELDEDPVTGGRDIPLAKCMPKGALESRQSGLLQLTDSSSIANVILVDASQTVELVAFVVSSKTEQWFIPNVTVRASVEALEVSTKAIELIRGHMAARIPEVERQRLTALPQIELVNKQAQGRKADVLFSKAVEVYCSDPTGLPNVLESAAEQRQRRKLMLHFAEYVGDLPLGEISSDLLRGFRDGPLRTFPANANHLPKHLVRETMKGTIQAIKDSGEEWPLLSQASQAERMTHLSGLFGWLHKKEWIAHNPAASLKGESGLSKAERRNASHKARSLSHDDDDEEGRQPFTPEEIVSIFAQSQYQTGDGRHITKGNQTWAPFEYWLPLLGLFAGCRIGEVSQLHLTDVREIDGVWALDINDFTKDKRVKTKETSIRRIPLHPQLIQLGFLDYCDSLRSAGFQRVFPELTYSASDARYGKEPIRKMSAMLESLGMPRNGEKVFHCLRHNANNALMRVPMSDLPYADVNLRQYIRYKLMGHALPEGDVNQAHYTKTTMAEMMSLVSGVDHELPEITKFNVSSGINAVRAALSRKKDHRRGKEDMGPLEVKS
jgi:integrase